MTRSSKLSEADKQALMAALSAGEAPLKISQRLGIAVSAVYYYRGKWAMDTLDESTGAEEGWVRKPNPAPAPPSAIPVTPAPAPDEAAEPPETGPAAPDTVQPEPDQETPTAAPTPAGLEPGPGSAPTGSPDLRALRRMRERWADVQVHAATVVDALDTVIALYERDPS